METLFVCESELSAFMYLHVGYYIQNTVRDKYGDVVGYDVIK